MWCNKNKSILNVYYVVLINKFNLIHNIILKKITVIFFNLKEKYFDNNDIQYNFYNY